MMSSVNPTAIHTSETPPGASRTPTRGGFGYMFQGLDPWAPRLGPGETQDEALEKIARQMFGPTRTHPTLPAGYTFLGQFAAHDVVFDARPDLGPDPTPVNRRRPRFDLECLYGGGPHAQPYLYSMRSPGQFLIGRTPSGELDLPRNSDDSCDRNGTTDACRWRRALIADPRNDQHTIIAQLHLAFMLFHNKLVSRQVGRSFEEARELTRWHYQWVLLQDFLPRLCGPEAVATALDRTRSATSRHFAPRVGEAWMPYEFSFAAYRLGHSMLGETYVLNDDLADRETRGGLLELFAFGDGSRAARERLAGACLDGERQLPSRWTVQWDRFVDTDPDRPAQRAQKIDEFLAPPISWLPLPGQAMSHRSLPFRTLRRGLDLHLPKGRDVAERLGHPPLPDDDPLWIYILKEAAATPRNRLGAVGATIVAETFVGLLQADPTSYLVAKPSFRPTLGPSGSDFDLKAFLDFSGVPITRQDWRRAVDRSNG